MTSLWRMEGIDVKAAGLMGGGRKGEIRLRWSWLLVRKWGVQGRSSVVGQVESGDG